MTGLFWPSEPVLPGIHPSEQWVRDLRARISDTLGASLKPLDDILRLVNVYAEFVNLDVDLYVAQKSKLAKRHGPAFLHVRNQDCPRSVAI